MKISELTILDMVLLKAGLHDITYQKSPGGWEGDLQVNTLSTTLLALLMLQWMRDVKKPGQIQHLTFTSSGSHLDPDVEASYFPKQDILNHSNQETNFVSSRRQYGISKLLLMYASREIANLALDDAGRYIQSPMLCQRSS